jgi:type IV pilus assembly protein PilM
MLFKKKSHLIGLDIGSRAIKVADVEIRKKGYALRKFGIMDISPGLIEEGSIRNPEEVADAIRQLLKDNRIKESNVATSIGGYSTIVKNITVQKMEEEQLQETIQFEAEQYIPFDINDVNLDFQILGENESNANQMNVLLVAAKKEMVTDYLNLLQMADLSPVIMDVDAFAIQNVYELNNPPGNENVCLIDIGANKTNLNILKGPNSVFMRDVSLGCHQINEKIASLNNCSLEEAEQMYQTEESDKLPDKNVVEVVSTVVNGWCTEIRRALDFFSSQYPDDPVRKIVLSGGGANIKKFRKELSVETAADVEIINPFDTFSVDGGIDPALLDRYAPQAAVCTGLAVRRIHDK